MKKAIVLLSGGLDSTTCLAYAKNKGYELYTLSFNYGQKQNKELELATYNSKLYGVKKHHIIKLDNSFFASSALANEDIDVPKDNKERDEIPVTYVPARNTIMLSYALAYAEAIDCSKIFIGVNSVDYSGYPDCRKEYIEAFEEMANLAIKKAVENKIKIEIETPLISLTKGEIISLGKSFGVDYSKTLTCYDPIDGKACGKCDSCILRKNGFKEANIKDETIYFE